MEQITYNNKHGKPVALAITYHARIRFSQRWGLVFPDRHFDGNVDYTIAEWFRKAKRINPEGKKYDQRLKRHGEDSLYFSAPPFIFVVQSSRLLTVELATRDTRHLNKVDHVHLAQLGHATGFHEQNLQQENAQLQKFHITGIAFDIDGKRRMVNLGKYNSCGSLENFLSEDVENNFKSEILSRFREKGLNTSLDTLVVRQGNAAMRLISL